MPVCHVVLMASGGFLLLGESYQWGAFKWSQLCRGSKIKGHTEGPQWAHKNPVSRDTFRLISAPGQLNLPVPENHIAGMGRSVLVVISGALSDWQGRGVSRTQEHETSLLPIVHFIP